MLKKLNIIQLLGSQGGLLTRYLPFTSGRRTFSSVSVSATGGKAMGTNNNPLRSALKNRDKQTETSHQPGDEGGDGNWGRPSNF